MRGLGLIFCMFGVFIAALGVIGYFADHEGLGIAGMVLGAGFLGIGTMIFLTEFVLLLARRNANLFIRGRLFNIELVVKGELRSPVDESWEFEESRGYVSKAAESGEQ